MRKSHHDAPDPPGVPVPSGREFPGDRLPNAPAKRWLFITYCSDPKRPFLDASARYRCFDRAADLRKMGLKAAVISQQRFLRDPPMNFDRYVFHRPWYTQDFGGLLDYLRRRGRQVLADYDAPLFAEEMKAAPRPPFPELISNSIPAPVRFQRALRLFDTVTVATEALGDWVSESHPNASIRVIESGLGADWRELADALYTHAREPETAICVGAGDDVELDRPLTKRLLTLGLQRSPDLKFLLDAELHRELGIDHPRIIARIPAAGSHDALSRAPFLMLPAVRHRWNDAASGIQALKATYLGCEVLATPLPGFLRHDWAGIRFLESEEDWMGALVKLATDASLTRASPNRDNFPGQALSSTHTQRLLECCA